MCFFIFQLKGRFCLQQPENINLYIRRREQQGLSKKWKLVSVRLTGWYWLKCPKCKRVFVSYHRRSRTPSRERGWGFLYTEFQPAWTCPVSGNRTPKEHREPNVKSQHDTVNDVLNILRSCPTFLHSQGIFFFRNIKNFTFIFTIQ